jgi:cell division protein YceG involved in septum cleavage
VIYNRLRSKMALGIDATVQYAAGSWAPITTRDLASASPYNTRRFKGLPPTPICNPGLASIQAAANPAKVPYLYYVAIPGDAQRRHFFTASFAAFNAYIAKHGIR